MADSRGDAYARVERELAVLFRRGRSYLLEVARSVHPELEPSGYGLLAFLAERDGVRARELVDHFGIDKAAVSRQVGQLVRLGLLRRDPDPDDARAQLLVVPRTVRRRLRRAREERSLGVRERLSSWDPDDVAALGKLLARLNAGDPGLTKG